MADQPKYDRASDAAYWGLTLAEKAGWMVRTAEYHQQLIVRFDARARRKFRVAIPALVGAVVLNLGELWLRWLL